MHSSGAPENDSFIFIDSVTRSDLPNQAETWGLAEWDIEEISLNGESSAKKLISSLATSLSKPPAKPPVRRYNSEGYDLDSPGDDITTVFLTDLISAHPHSPRILWLGERISMCERLKTVIRGVYPAASVDTMSTLSQFDEIIKGTRGKAVPYDFIILDFRAGDSFDESERQTLQNSLGGFLHELVVAHSSGKKHFDGTVIGIDVVNTPTEQLFHRLVKAARVPYLIGFRHGTIQALSRRQLFMVRMVILERNLHQHLNRTRLNFIIGFLTLPRRLYRVAVRAFTTQSGLRLGNVVSRRR